jgi:3-oxoacyl-[acyl-carrier protein] reductase
VVRKMYSFDGQVALVTGGTEGIGKAIALCLARGGAKVVVNYSSDEESALSTDEELRKINGFGLSLKADVSDSRQVQEMFGKILDATGGTLDLLVNNAGIIRDSLLMLMKDEDWKRVIDVNLTGVYNCSKAALRPMIGEKWGRIINIISPTAFMGRAGQTNYAASKGGILSFTRSLSREVASYGITVNAVSPGLIETELTSSLSEKVKNEFLGMIPGRRLGSTEEVSHAVAFLASVASGYTTGSYISVDGGMT